MRQARYRGRQLLAAAAAVLGCVLLLIGVPSRASAAALSSATWTVSKTTAGQTGAGYTYTLMPSTGSTLSKVTMTVPSGTTGTPALETVTPSIIAGGSVTLSGGLLTYTFPPVSVPAGLVLTIPVSGLSTPGTPGTTSTPTSTITTYNGGTAVDAGTASFTFAASALTAVSWLPSSTTPGAANVSYTYTFSSANLFNALAIGTITITVPPGTGGIPGIGPSSPALSAVTSVSLSGSTLTVGYSPGLLVILSPVTITITGLTNTYTAGSYEPEIVTSNGGGIIDSGVAPAVTFTPTLAVGAPASLSWNGTLAGPVQALADTSPADQQLTVDDSTNSGAGWHVTVSATSFVTGSGYTLPAAGVLDFNGSVSSAATAAAPTASCLGATACTLPNDSAVTYPVVITSAPSSPMAATVYDAQPGTGIGPMTLGGSGAAKPVGWWVNFPATAQSGSYTSVVNVSIISGP